MFIKKTLTVCLFLLVTQLTLGQSYLYNEEFYSSSTWPTGDNETRHLYLTGGKYYFEHKRTTKSWYVSSSTYNLDQNKDFELEMSVLKISGVDDRAICFYYDFKDSENFKSFDFTSNGHYRISKSIEGTYSNEVGWTKSSYIKKGNYSTNVLKLKKEGTKLKFYINGNFVKSLDFVKFNGTKSAINLFYNQKVALDYLRVKQNNYTTNSNYSYTKNHKILETILFDGYTSNKNYWSEKNDENIEFKIENGNYYLKHKRDNSGWTSTIKKYIDTSRDFKILASFKHVSGVDNKGFGLIFGRNDSQNQNHFIISGNGQYYINKIDNNQDNYLKKWTKLSKDRIYNTLKIIKIGSKLEYYVNDEKVYTDYNPKFFGDRLGYVVYGNQKIMVTYLSLGYLDKKHIETNYDTKVVDNVSKQNYYNDSDYKFSEQFNSNSNYWATENKSTSEKRVTNGKYYIKNKTESGNKRGSILTTVDFTKDYELEAKIDKISGVTNYSFGVNWAGNGSSYFRFYIASSQYKIAKYNGSSEVVLSKWSKTDHINSGNQKSNLLKIKKSGDYIKFYLNNKFLTQIDYETPYGRKVGIELWNKQEIAADFIRIKQSNTYYNTTVVSNLKAPFTEMFTNNNNKWFVDDLESYSSEIKNGRLVIERKSSGGIFISKNIDIDTKKDFSIEATITNLKSESSGYFGITFGRKSSGNEYSLLLSPTGSYKFRKFENDKHVEIIPTTFSSFLKNGYFSKNKIKIVKSNSLLRFYINDQYVTETKYQEFYGNKLGFTVYEDQKIGVDNLSIAYLTEKYNNPPIVTITEPDVSLKRGFKIVKSKKIIVRGHAKDSDGIFEVTVNGIDAHISEDGSFTANVPLKIGSNELIVKATDIKQSSATKTFTIKRKSPDVDYNINNTTIVNTKTNINVGFGEYYALIIGVSNYDETSDVPNLEGLPTRDAKDLADVLVSKYSFKKENITLLNNSPKENEIMMELFKLRQKSTSKDNVLIFYAGHGIYDKASGTGSWLPSDANPKYELNLIRNSTIKDNIKQIKSKHTLLISDACFSGSIFKTRSLKSAPKSISRKYELPSRKAITSGTLKTVPNESVFLKYLIKRLSENQNAFISARQLFDSFEEAVMNNSNNVPQYGTIHGVGDEGGDFIFVKKN